MKFKYESKKSLRAKLADAEMTLRELRSDGGPVGIYASTLRDTFDLTQAIYGETRSSLRKDIEGLIDLGAIPERYRARPTGHWITPPLLDSKQISADLDAIKAAEQVKQGEMLLKERGEKEPF